MVANDTIAKPATAAPSLIATIEAWVVDKISYLKQGLSSLLGVLGTVEKDLLNLLDLAIEDAPKLTALLGTVANVVTTALPNGKLGAYINDAITLIGDGIPYVKTADGILMSLVEATATGADKNATPVPQTSAVIQLMAQSNPGLPDAVHATIIPMIVAAQAVGTTIGSPTN